MATVREYFDLDVKTISIHTTWALKSSTDTQGIDVQAKIAFDFEANAKYWYIYVPATPFLQNCLQWLLSYTHIEQCNLGPEGDGACVKAGISGSSEWQTSDTMQFTRRINLYLDANFSISDRAALVGQALARGFYLNIRDCEYATLRSENEKPLAFISHDSKDKDSFVRSLAAELMKNNCAVWYDEYSLQVGDSLRENIERGLRETRKCIVVLSPNFLANEGWGKAEFDSIFTREIIEKKNVILPVWLNVGVEDVYKYSPRLADKIGLSAALGAEEVAQRLACAVKAT